MEMRGTPGRRAHDGDERNAEREDDQHRPYMNERQWALVTGTLQ
jgi:hypothetical protein